MGVIPQNTIREGSWFQPYIHSVPDNYVKARDSYYQGFTLEPAVTTTKEIATKVFANLLDFYEKREKYFAEKVLKIPYDELPDKLTDFLNKIEDILKDDKAKGDKYGLFTELRNAMLELRASMQEALALAEKTVEKRTKAAVSRAKQKARKEQQIKQRTTLTNILQDPIKAIIAKHQLKDPDKLLQVIFDHLVTGKDIPKAHVKNAQKIITIFQKENAEMQRIIAQGGQALKDTTKEGTNKVTDPAIALAKAMGFYNEDIFVDKMNGLTARGQRNLLAAFGNALTTKTGLKKGVTFEVKGTGTVKTNQQMQDAEFIITNKNEPPFVLGVDMKFTTSGQDKYSRGENVKTMGQIVSLFPNENLAKDMMYLLTNSYYHEGDKNPTWNNIIGSSKDGKAELFNVINMIRGLFGLLPSSQDTSFSNIDNIDNFVLQDKRFFVVINDNVLPMTDFLNQVKGIVLPNAPNRFTGSVTGLTRDVEAKADSENQGLRTILNRWNTSHEITQGKNKRGKLYNKKLNIVNRTKNTNKILAEVGSQLRLDFYNTLKLWMNKTLTRDELKTKWKFSITINYDNLTPRGR